jgi:hypothetical protein
MWKTFWGEDLDHISPSNMKHVVPGAWRVELSPAHPSKEDVFLNVLEIGNKGDESQRRVELTEGSNFSGALVAGETLALFATGQVPAIEGEVTLPDVEVKDLIVTGLKPESKYQLDITGGRSDWGGGLFQGVHLWNATADTDRAGVLRVPFVGHKDARLRLRFLE